MRASSFRWRDVSIVKKLYFVVGVMATLIAGELIILRFAMHKLSAARAFVGGEGSWSKAYRDEFLSIASHELKTPITAMHLQLQLLERKYEERHVQAALDRSRKLRLLLDELFDLTRLRSGKLELHLASIALKPILLDIVQTLQTEAETKGSVLKRLFGTSLSF